MANVILVASSGGVQSGMKFFSRRLNISNQNVVRKKGVQRTREFLGIPGWRCVKSNFLCHGVDAGVRAAGGMDPYGTVQHPLQLGLDRSLDGTDRRLDLVAGKFGTIVLDGGTITDGGE